MEFHSMRKVFYPNHLGEEKQQMLDLNRRLETYLNRVKLLEEENDLLANEIKTLRYNNQGALALRKGLEEELQQTRLEVDAAWRERVLTELEVEKLNEELQDLELQRQREAQAKVMVNTKMEQSRRELEEERRAQIWLREKVNQLEHEMRLLVQTHEDDVAHMEATLSQSRAAAPPVLAQRCNQTPDLLRVGHEFSERANRAWQEASEAYQGQLAQLEESLNQARSRLNHVCQEKHENQLKLQALEKEISSGQDVQLHLEKTVARRQEEHNQEIHQLQEHLENLEVEKEELALQIDHLLQENRGLMQMKMSLSLEVATYRALLDSESLGADVVLSNKPRNISIRDAAPSPHGFKKNYQTQLSASLRTTFPSSVLGITGATATQIRSRKPVTLNETPKIPSRPANRDPAKSAALKSLYPKIVQDRAAENLRPLEVHETVTYAESLSPSNEEEVPIKCFEGEQKEEWNFDDVEPAESVVSQKVESVLSSEPPRDDEAGLHHFTTPGITLCNFQVTEESCRASDEPNMVADFQTETEKDVKQLQAQTEAPMETQHVDKEAEDVQEETSDSETEAMLEPTPESRSSRPESECDPTDGVFNQMINSNIGISNEDVAVIKQELSTSVETDGKEAEDNLYPDGEEMDTWDSVIERKVDVQTENEEKNEDKKQHAEPEEDISAKEPEEEIRGAHHIGNMASSMTLTRAGDERDIMLDQELAPPPDFEEEHDEEDSQNVSVSWRTELESESYAQENTLADTRPLIRYKSDDTDANTVASHIDESESSEGEQEKKMEEAGIGTWGDGKSKTFGTMEDLCEEVEEEAIDEDYNLGYTHVEDRDVSQGTIGSEHVTLVTEEMLKNGTEEHSDKGNEDLTKADVEMDVELETDRLVEQELENLSTHSFSADFAQQQVREEILQMEDPHVEEVNEQVEAEKATEDNLSSFKPWSSLNYEDISSTVDQALDTFSDPNVEMHPTNTVAEEETQAEDHEVMNKPEKGEEEGEHDIAMVPQADATEDHSSFTDFISRDEMKKLEEINPEDPNSEFQQDGAVIPEIPEETPNDSQEHVSEDVEEFHTFPDPATAEWEVLETPMQEFEIRDQNKDDQKYEKMPDSADEDVIINQKEPVEISPDRAQNKNDIFIMKDATDSSLHDLFPSDVKSDFWVSSLEGGATYEPDEAPNEAAEQTNQNQGFIDNQVCEGLENRAVVNGNSQLDVESSKAKAATKEQEVTHMEQKKVLVYSEESEAEAESWSSGEEPV